MEKLPTLLLSLLTAVGAINLIPLRASGAEADVTRQGVQLKAAAWETRDPQELAALRGIAADPRMTAPDWGVASTLQLAANSNLSKVALGQVKYLPAEPLPGATQTIQWLDHYQVVPAHTEAVYREIEVEAGSADVKNSP